VSDPAKLLSLGWKPECTFSRLAAMMMAEAARRCETEGRWALAGRLRKKVLDRTNFLSEETK